VQRGSRWQVWQCVVAVVVQVTAISDVARDAQATCPARRLQARGAVLGGEQQRSAQSVSVRSASVEVEAGGTTAAGQRRVVYA